MRKMISGLAFLVMVIFTTTPATASPRLSLSDMADILPEWAVTTSEAGGKFILSDSPEKVEREGILYQDKVQGDVRLFFHHVNAMPEGKRIVVMLLNQGTKPAKVELVRQGVSGPDYDYLRAGRAIQAEYFRGMALQKFEVLPGKALRLPPTKQIPIISSQSIFTGMLDFRSDQEVRLVVAAMPVEADPAAFVAQAEVLPPGKPHLRGTFRRADRVLLASRSYDPSSDGPVAITLGDGQTDPYLEGRDATTGQNVRNEGNYGVVYRIMIPTTGKGKIRCYMNPRGGVYAGWIAVKTKLGEKLVGTPAKSLSFGHTTLRDFEMIAEFMAGESLWVTFSPPGASNLPVRLMLVPEP